MPDPVYIICSQSGSEDAATKLVSLFNVLERIRIVKLDLNELPIATPSPVPIRVTAAWMRRENEAPEQEYESQIVFSFPAPVGEKIMGTGSFRFGKKPLARVVAAGDVTYFPTPGVLRVTCRVRPAGTSEKWDEQSYPIFLVEFQGPADESTGAQE